MSVSAFPELDRYNAGLRARHGGWSPARLFGLGLWLDYGWTADPVDLLEMDRRTKDAAQRDDLAFQAVKDTPS